MNRENLKKFADFLIENSDRLIEEKNNPTQIAARINYMLQFGVPDNWYEQMYGIEKPCYRPTIVTLVPESWESRPAMGRQTLQNSSKRTLAQDLEFGTMLVVF